MGHHLVVHVLPVKIANGEEKKLVCKSANGLAFSRKAFTRWPGDCLRRKVDRWLLCGLSPRPMQG